MIALNAGITWLIRAFQLSSTVDSDLFDLCLEYSGSVQDPVQYVLVNSTCLAALC